MRRSILTPAVTLSVISLPLAAQPAAPVPATTRVTGVVYDSVARRPFAFASVQLVRASDAPTPGGAFAVTADSTGRFRIDDVPPGTYVGGFFHPTLDSLGLQAPLRRIEIRARGSARLDLALPAAPRVVRTLCPAAPTADGALLVGFVRDATTHAPRPGATVEIAWTSLVIAEDGLQQRDAAVEVHAQPNGWFAVCGVPGNTAIRLRAYHDADTSGIVALDALGRDLALRDLYVGRAGGARTGGGRLTGTVRSTAGAPVAGARVRVLDGADSATTDDAGAFALASLPLGSQTLDVRAVGYLPLRRVVDLVGPDGVARADVRLTGFRALLDTMKIVNRRVYKTDRTGFEERRRSAGTGHFVTREMLDRMRPITMTDVLLALPGVRIAYTPRGHELTMGGRQFTARLGASLAPGGPVPSVCRPTVYVDGAPLSLRGDDFGTTTSMIESLDPADVEGIEVYSATNAPLRFRAMRGDCGAMVIWTR